MKFTILFLVVATFAVSSAFDFGSFPFQPFQMDEIKMPKMDDIKMPSKDDITNLGSDGKGVVQGTYQSQSFHSLMKDGKIVSQGSKSDRLVNNNRNITETTEATGDN